MDLPANWLHLWLTELERDAGGAAIFSWPADHIKSRDVLRTLHGVPDAALPHAIVRFMFEFFENTYFSPAWWDGLESSVQASAGPTGWGSWNNLQFNDNAFTFLGSAECFLRDTLSITRRVEQDGIERVVDEH